MKDSLVKKLGVRIFVSVFIITLFFTLIILFILSKKIDRNYISKIKSLNTLVSSELVDYNVAIEKNIVESILGLEVNTIVILGLNGHIYYSTNEQYQGKDLWEIKSLQEAVEFKDPHAKIKAKKQRIDGDRYFIATTPIIDENNEHIGYMYSKTYYDGIAREKLILYSLFVGGMILCIVVIMLVYVNSTRKKIISPINNLTEKVKEIEKGNIQNLKSFTDSNDEIGTLEKHFSKLTQNLSELSKFANEIEERNFNYQFKPVSENDNLGNALIGLRDSIEKASKEDEQRKKEDEISNWETQGIAKFAEILRRDNDNMKQLGYNVISNLVEYLGANQGGFFLINDENKNEPYIELQAAYAYNKRKFLEKRIEWGVGLLGNCILEGKTVYMSNVPDDYISITSGLGDSNPRSLLIVPLIANNEKFGAIEIASFNKLEKYQIEFVNRLSESIGSTIATVKINVQTSKLLKETNEQSERIRQAEEEMRQNMEEMQATQEESERREQELQKQLNEALNKIKELENKN